VPRSRNELSEGDSSERLTEFVGGGHDQGPHLIDGRGAVPGGGAAHQSERPNGLYAACCRSSSEQHCGDDGNAVGSAVRMDASGNDSGVEKILA